MKREAFLARVRQALHRSPGDPREVPPVPPEPLATWDCAVLMETFSEALAAVGVELHRVDSWEQARAVAGEVLGELVVNRSGEVAVGELLKDLELEFTADPTVAEIGVTGVLCAIAETGTLVLSSEAGRFASLLPMRHLALVREEQLVPTMAEALAKYGDELPSAWVQATGPSRTADIELTLSIGVHGPGVVHVVLLSGS
ncbi:MAG: LUD domain-containing protein [Trueperaceae bacterium]|nr:MAG: LUD domain-containing protein [Trueperaceae bacterium]